MDVTNGLISRLVKTKSTERVLAPIASQVSLLMILNDVGGQGDDIETADGSTLNVAACVEQVTRAVDGFISVGHDQIQKSSDPLFHDQMSGACETLELAKTELYVAGQSVSGIPGSNTSQSALVQAAKDILQAILRVLIVADDVEVRKCVQAVTAVEEKIKCVGSVTDSHELVPTFKELTEALLYMTMVVNARQKDLVSGTHQDDLVTGLSLMRKGMSSLRMAVQTYLKYPRNPQALAGKQQVVDQALNTLADIRTVLESAPPSELDSDEAGHFVEHIDKVLEGLGESGRFSLHPDLESWIAGVVRHAMSVAHLCSGTYRQLITRTCQRILQSKFRLFELREAMIHSPHLQDVRLDYEGVCEVLLDEFCEVEKHVNMALLNLIIDTCCFTSQPLEHLARTALSQQDITADIGQSEMAEEFSRHADKVCQVASMAAASSMDPKKVRSVKVAVSRLEQLHPEVLPALRTVVRCHSNVVAVRQLKRLVQEWEAEMDSLVQGLDSMTDPAVFLQVTEQRIRQGVNVVRGSIASGDKMEVKAGLRKLLAHSRRIAQVANRVVDSHCDPVFRNGLLVFIQQLNSARSSVKEAGRLALEDLTHPRLVDTLHRRLALLIDAAADVRKGLKGDNHVDVLSPVRRNVRRPALSRRDVARVLYPRKSQAGKERMGSQEQLDHEPESVIQKKSSTALHSVQPQHSNTTSAMTDPPGSKQKVPDKVSSHRSPHTKSSQAVKQRGESSLMLQSCGDGLVAAAVGGDGGEVARWCGEVLGWTSHLGEAAISLVDHAHHSTTQSEMRGLGVEVDRLAPQLIETARFVAAGDRGQTDSLRRLADDWVAACNKLRILVDVVAGDWLVLIEQIGQAVTVKDVPNLKTLLGVLERNQREMNQLLSRARNLEGRHVPGGAAILQFLREGQLELDGLTATVKTTADCLASTEDTNTINRSQLIQRGREWCVLMTGLVAELDYIADTLATTGQSVLGVPAVLAGSKQHKVDSKVAPLLQAETGRLKDMLTCLAAGDSGLKKRCDELTESLTEIMGEVTEIAHTPVDDNTLPQAQLFGRLDAGLARSRWTEKAVDAEQLVQRHCLRFSALINNMLYTAVSDPSAVHEELSQLSDKVKAVTQRTLQAIQLSSDLPERGAVRHCLDDLTNLLPTITHAATACASGRDKEKNERELQRAADQWGATVHRLISTLRSMGDVKPTVVKEIETQLTAQPVTPQLTTQQFPSNPPAQPQTQQATWPQTQPTALPPHQQAMIPQTQQATQVTRSQNQQSTRPSWSPPVNNRPAVGSGSPARSTSTPRSGKSSAASEVLEMSKQQPLSSSSPLKTMSPYRRSALYTSWLASARYLGDEVAGWEGDENHFAQLVRTMAVNCQQMADFSRGGASLKDSDEMSNTGLELAAGGKELVTFARSLQEMCPNQRRCGELKKAGDKIASYANQLRIVASVLQNAPSNPEADCILARNAANLVQAVREMFSVAEGVSVAGLLEPRDGNEVDHQVVDLLTKWQHKLASYHVQQAQCDQIDDLGLRRMEIHNPPSLVKLADAR